MTRKKTVSGAEEDAPADTPLRGGSYVRRTDGTLDRIEFTESDVRHAAEQVAAEDAASEERVDG